MDRPDSSPAGRRQVTKESWFHALLATYTRCVEERRRDAAKDSAEFVTKKAENLTKRTVQAVGSAVGLTTTGAALSVDKDGNGKSDMLEFREKKKEQKAVIELASAVLDVI